MESENSSSSSSSDDEEVDNPGQEEEDEGAVSDVDEEEEVPKERLGSGTIVVAVYEGEWFVAEVINQDNVPKDYVRLSYMTMKGLNKFAWPEKKDIFITYKDDILLENIELDTIGTTARGIHVRLHARDYMRVLALMVVAFTRNEIFCKIFLQNMHKNFLLNESVFKVFCIYGTGTYVSYLFT